jgi:hypothetical protein
MTLTNVITTPTSHECDYNTQECAFNTHKIDFYMQSTISIRSVWVYTLSVSIHAECGFNTHESNFDTYAGEFDNHECDYDTLVCDFYTQSVISTRVVILTRTRHSQLGFQNAQEWFSHAECDFDTYECDYDTHECDYDTPGICNVMFFVTLCCNVIKI